MKKINKYAFLVLLVITVIIAAPFIIRKLVAQPAEGTTVTGSGADTASVISSASQTQESAESSASPAPASSAPAASSTASIPASSVPSANTNTEFFNDALFIGDSRTVGLSEYGKIKGATFFANTGMSVYKILKTDVSVASVGKMRLDELLAKKSYGKIYIMLGINELGYNFNATMGKYEDMVNTIHRLNPNAKIYILANLHVTKNRSDSDKIFTNSNIDRFNEGIAQLADNTSIFYLDMNELYDDGAGNLRADYSGDGIHLRAKYYAEWGPWLQSHSIKN